MARILSRLRQARHRFSVANLFHHEPTEQQQPEPEPQTSEMGAQKDKTQYDEFAEAYHKSTGETPHSLLESDLIRTALGDCKDCRILDLAGGSGNHARIAIEAGAAHIDLVDISASMMEIGEEMESKAGRDVIRWILADISRPLSEQAVVPSLPREGYDIVMAIWSFDHVGTPAAYYEVWRNVACYLKPGGKLVGCRVRNPWSHCVQEGKYGARVKLTEPIPGGVKSSIVVNTKPPFEFDSTAMEESLRGDTALPEYLGIGEVKSVDAAETEVVRGDAEFWADFIEVGGFPLKYCLCTEVLVLQDPYFVVFTARKKETP